MKIFDKEQLLNNKTLAFLTPIEYSEEYFKLLNRNTNLKEISISQIVDKPQFFITEVFVLEKFFNFFMIFIIYSPI